MESMALDAELDLDDKDLEKLESDVKQMAQKISEYRQTLPDNLRNTLDSVLSPCIPVFPNFDSGSDPLSPSRLPIADTVLRRVPQYSRETTRACSDPCLVPLLSVCYISTNPERQVPVVLGTEEQDSGEKMIQLKERMSRNAANVPKVVKRVRECIESIDKLASLDVTIHPAFRRRRIN